jgi:colanic acid/amylovoran biosynthesis protein
MPEVLITFAGLSWQKGSAAQVISLVDQIRQIRSDVRITLLSHCGHLDAKPAARIDIEVAGIPISRRAGQTARSLALALMNIRVIASGLSSWIAPRCTPPRDWLVALYRQSDLVLDLSGDSYRDPPGGYSPAHNLMLLACRTVNRPCALISQSIGPFRARNEPLTRWCLNGAALIYVREMRSFELLLRLGVHRERLLLAPDLAFTLRPATTDCVTKILEREFPRTMPKPWIGVSPSGLLFTRLSARERLFQARALQDLVRHILRRVGGTVLLIPHEISPAGYHMDDVAAAEIIAEGAGCSDSVCVLRGDYDPGVIKGIVGRLDALVASRMHAGIAGLSSSVPTLMISWSHKYEGLMEQIGLPEFVWNVSAPSPAPLNEVFDDLWIRREEVRRHLSAYNETVGPVIHATVAQAISGLP